MSVQRERHKRHQRARLLMQRLSKWLLSMYDAMHVSQVECVGAWTWRGSL